MMSALTMMKRVNPTWDKKYKHQKVTSVGAGLCREPTQANIFLMVT